MNKIGVKPTGEMRSCNVCHARNYDGTLQTDTERVDLLFEVGVGSLYPCLCEKCLRRLIEVATAAINKDAASKKMCLFCGNSMSAIAADGTDVLVCFECEGHEGKEMIVDDDECCSNFNA